MKIIHEPLKAIDFYSKLYKSKANKNLNLRTKIKREEVLSMTPAMLSVEICQALQGLLPIIGSATGYSSWERIFKKSPIFNRFIYRSMNTKKI